jgi:hypothetical protein
VTEYTTKDSGQHAQYDSGMRRDSESGKPRFDLIRTKLQPYEEQMIYRYAMLLARGAEKYSARNWEEGDSEEELERAKSSLLRHTEQLIAGETDEDHAAAVWFNTQAIEYFRWRIAQKEGVNDGIRHDLYFPALELKLESINKDLVTLLVGRALPADWEETGWLGEAPEAFQSPERDNEDDFSVHKQRHQMALNDWHNRPTAEPKLRPGPPATPTDRIKAEANANLSQLLASSAPLSALPKQRVDDWLKTYGIELIEGSLGDPYEKIHEVEFCVRLKTGATKLEKSGVANALDIQ